MSKGVSCVRLFAALLVAGSAIAVVLGRSICTKTTASGALSGLGSSDWSCKGHVHPDNWKQGGMEGQYFVVGASVVVFLYFLGFLVLDCCGRRTGKLEMILSALSTVAMAVAAGLEFYYGIFYYYGSASGFLGVDSIGATKTTQLVVSYIVAGAGYTIVAFLGLGDVCAVLKGL